ncbi:MAG: cupin domain-containing protein [Methanolinea sp.]|jgi:cytosine deaminase|nr:cupin domain-containing protein [Methanolinea sp.]
MFLRHVAGCRRERAGDGSLLCEIVHPHRERDTIPFRPSIAHAIVPPGESTLPHRLRQSTEVYCIVAGKGRMHIDGESSEVGEGCAVLIPRGAVQWVENTGNVPLAFYAIVDPAWRREDEEVFSPES